MRTIPFLAVMAMAAGAADAGPAVRSAPLRGGQAAQRISADLGGARLLALRATGYSWGQAVWGEPLLIAADGSTQRLARLAPEKVHVGWGSFGVGRGPDGRPLSVAGRAMADGFFAHADSHLVFRLDREVVRFESWIGINDTAGPRGEVVFEVCDPAAVEWDLTVARLRRGFTRDCFAWLRRVLDAPRGSGADGAVLRGTLAGYERDFDTLRAALDGDPAPVRDRLAAFEVLVGGVHRLYLDAPLLFVKRHPYFSAHIYDDYLTWHPGGGIHVIENPREPAGRQVVRALIDPSTPETLGEGVYRDPELSFDGTRLLFAFKGDPKGDTSIHELRLGPAAAGLAPGRGLRRLTQPSKDCAGDDKPAGLIGEGHHDIAPCWMPDGRIVFLSTRTAGLVMCFNNYIATLHTMNADGSDVRCISVNNVSEFDPAILPDGRILYGRWEYVDKTALYMQSLWVVNPDGTGETAVFANNLAKPTALLDARPVPGSPLLAAALTPHNGQSVGAIATVDPRLGKNRLEAIVNFTPEYPTEMDQGLRLGPSDPWPLDGDVMLIADNAAVHGPHGVLQVIDRFGFRTTIRSEPDISCFSPMLVKARPQPPVIPPQVKNGEPARFLVHDVYQGLDGIPRGAVKQLRLLETTSRISGVPPGGRWWNQAFLVSWQGSYDVKNFLGVVPVEPDGSAYFEAPPGRALYVQALDGNGRLVQSMRTFVQAAPGVTRSCQGCHVKDDDQPPVNRPPGPLALRRAPSVPQREPWGRGALDYPSMVQPVLDRRCVRCHGGAEGIAAGLDLGGGWTWAFSLSYESLIARTQTGFLNCNNGSVHTAEILPPRAHGSGAAPLADRLAKGHGGATPEERALLLAWMDGNCNYAGTWDYTPHATCEAVPGVREPLLAEMDRAGCLKCHDREIGSDWVNLQTPAWSRMLRAPLAAGAPGGGLGWCRDRKARPVAMPLVTQKIQPPDVRRPAPYAAPDRSGPPATVFADASAPAYRSMLAVIESARVAAQQSPRADMPGAVPARGRSRELAPLAPPAVAGE